MGIFIEMQVHENKCQVASGCTLCTTICPVDVFVIEDHKVEKVFDNEDECTLCNLCVEQCPGQAIRLVKLYEQ